MHKLTTDEIAKRLDMVQGCAITKRQLTAEKDELKSKLKRVNHLIKENDRDTDTLWNEILTGEAEPEQRELPNGEGE